MLASICRIPSALGPRQSVCAGPSATRRQTPSLLKLTNQPSFHHHHHNTIPPTKTPWPGPSFHVVRRPRSPFSRRLDPNRPRLSCSSPCPCLAYAHRPSLRHPPPIITSTHLPHPAITRAMAQCNSIQVIVHRLPVLDPFVPSPLPHRLLPSTRANGSHTHCNSGWATETRPTWPRPSFHLLLWLRRTLRPCSHHLLLLRVGIANKLARLHHTAPASTH